MSVRLILASGSPRRADVLHQLGLRPEIRPADIDESYFEGESPEAHVERLAREKAVAVADGAPGALVVGGDTIVLDAGRVLGKPTDAAAAVGMLTGLAGRAHQVLTGLAIAGPHGVVSAVSAAVVRMRAFDEVTARRYVATGEPLDKAGAYGIQGRGAVLVEAIEGDYYTIVGFPVPAFIDLLGRAGWRYAFGRLARSTD